MRVLRDALLCGLLLAGIIVLARVDRLVRDTDQAMLDTQAEIHGSIQNTNAVLIQLGLASDEWRQASIEQRTQLLKTSKETTLAVHDLRTMIAHYDADAVKLGEQLDAVGPGLKEATRALKGAADVLNDPAIPASLKNVEAISRSTTKSSEHIEHILGKGTEIADDAQGKFHAMTHPTKKQLILGFLKTAFLTWLVGLR